MRRAAASSVSPLIAGLVAAAIFMAAAGAYEIGRIVPGSRSHDAIPAHDGLAMDTRPDPDPARLAEHSVPAASPPPVDTRPLVVLVIDDAGPDAARTQALIDLPVAMTFSFLPYAEATPRLARSAADRGHEIFLHMPMEPVGLEDPGPGALTRHLPDDVLAERLMTALEQVPGATGFNNHMGSAFTADRAAVHAAFAPLAGRDLVFLDSLTSGRSRAAGIAGELGLVTLRRDLFIDHVAGEEATALSALEAMAQANRAVIAIAHPRPGTIAALRAWLDGPVRDELRFVTVAEYLALQSGPAEIASNEAVGLFGGAE